MKRKIIIGLILSIFLFSILSECGMQQYRYSLVALQNDTSKVASGGGIFFIWSATIKDEIYYYAYVKNEEGAISLIKLSYDSASFVEDATENNSYVLTYCNNIKIADSWDWEFHIPPNTIMKNINIDLVNLKGK